MRLFYPVASSDFFSCPVYAEYFPEQCNNQNIIEQDIHNSKDILFPDHAIPQGRQIFVQAIVNNRRDRQVERHDIETVFAAPG